MTKQDKSTSIWKSLRTSTKVLLILSPVFIFTFAWALLVPGSPELVDLLAVVLGVAVTLLLFYGLLSAP